MVDQNSAKPGKPCLVCEQRGYKCPSCHHAEIFGEPAAALATQPATSQEGEKPNRWYADAPKNIWLHGIGGGHETTWADDPSPTGDAEEDEHAVGYVRADISAFPEPVPATNQAGEVALRAGDRVKFATGEAGEIIRCDYIVQLDEPDGSQGAMGGSVGIWTVDASELTRAALATQPATSQEGEQGTALGEVQCACSEDDGVPDVGVSIGLGNGAALWIGETLLRDGSNIGVVFHGPDQQRVVVPLPDGTDWQEVADLLRHHVAPALKAVADKPWHLDAQATELLKKAATFLDSAAGEGLEIDDIDAMDLVTELHELLHIDSSKCFHEDAALFLDGKIAGTVPEGVTPEIEALIAWARSNQAFPEGNPGGEGRGHIDENARFKLRDMITAIDAVKP